MERKQLGEVDKALDRLSEKINANALDEDVLGRVMALVDALARRDVAAASSIQVALVNHDWAKHKDWLKGVKFLLQLFQKKM